jgi:hypothetical protein
VVPRSCSWARSGILDRVHAELSDQTFLAVPSPVLAQVVADPGRWARWWPDLEPVVSRDRGPKGQQWVLAGEIGGTAEIYLEPWHDGTLLNLYLRLELPARLAPGGRPDRDLRRRVLAWKRAVTSLKDELEAGRAPGTPAEPGDAHVPGRP